MKIAVPVENDRVCMHFGHCPAFAVYEADQAKKAITAKTILEAPPHEPGLLPRWLHEKGVNFVIAGGMGRRAQDLFGEQGIRVLVGAPADNADQVVTAYLEGRLQAGVNVCDH